MIPLARILTSYFLLLISPLHGESQIPSIHAHKIGTKIKGLEPYPDHSLLERARNLLNIDKDLLLEEAENCSANIAKGYGLMLWSNPEDLGKKYASIIATLHKTWFGWQLNRYLQNKLVKIPKDERIFQDLYDAFDEDDNSYLSEGDEEYQEVLATKQNYVDYKFNCDNDDAVEEIYKNWGMYKRRSLRLKDEIARAPQPRSYLQSHKEFMLYLTAEQLMVDGVYGISRQYNQGAATIFKDTLDITTRSFFKHFYTQRKAPLLAPSLLCSSIATDVSYAGGKRFIEKVTGTKISCPELSISPFLRNCGINEQNIEYFAKLIVKFSLKTMVMDKLFKAEYDPVPLF